MTNEEQFEYLCNRVRQFDLSEKADQARINNTLGKMEHYLATHESICVSVSGGSDSDVIVHIIATYFKKYLHKVHFVFANTGIEYRATLDHLDYLRSHYGIAIDEVRGMPIPVATKKYGIPFQSKQISEYLGRLLKHGFEYEDDCIERLHKELLNWRERLTVMQKMVTVTRAETLSEDGQKKSSCNAIFGLRQRRASDDLRRMRECNSTRRGIPESCLLQAVSLAHGKKRGRKQMQGLHSEAQIQRRQAPRHDGRGAG